MCKTETLAVGGMVKSTWLNPPLWTSWPQKTSGNVGFPALKG